MNILNRILNNDLPDTYKTSIQLVNEIDPASVDLLETTLVAYREGHLNIKSVLDTVAVIIKKDRNDKRYKV